MARSCGLRLGPRRFELVVLDGSAKKHKISAYYAGEFDTDVEDPVAHAVELLKDAAKAHRIPKENLGLVIDSGSAAFRKIELPFAEKSKLEQVLKFEVESDLPQWNIDEVVVDFHVLQEVDGGSELLVTAVPKADVGAAIKMCERAGLEPLEVQLESSAIFNAATSANICGPEDAQLLVHVGDLATTVVVVDGGVVREMRVIHIGALTHELALVAENNAEGEGEEGEAEVKKPDPVEVHRRVEQALQRIRRELGRTLAAASANRPIEAIYVCGVELPGLIGEPIMDVPVYVLDCFEEDGGQPVDGFGQLVAAYGAAITQLGGGAMQPRLRREDLAFTGAWERMEFPLAVAAMLLAMLGAAYFFMESQHVAKLENSVRFWVDSTNNYLVGEDNDPAKANMVPAPENVVRFVGLFPTKPGQPLKYTDPIEGALPELSKLVERNLKGLRESLGDTVGLQQPQSAFVAATLVLGVLEKHDAEWRVSLHKIQGDWLESNDGKSSQVEVRMTVTFWGENAAEATRDYERFRDALSQNSELFVGVDEKPTKVLPGDAGIYIEGLTVKVNVDAMDNAAKN